MKVALITGSYPPQICGVGDYAFSLADSLRSAGATVEIIHEDDWSPLRMRGVRNRLSSIGANVYHLQYPTKGYGWHLGPQVLALSTPLAVTIHEASQAHVLRQASLLPLTIRSPLVIFTTEYEREYLGSRAPWIRNRSLVIPIGSNIAVRNNVKKMSPRVVTYFGLIRPEKGIEDVLHLARIFKQSGNGFAVRIIGVPVPGCESYYARLRSEAVDLPVEWLIDLSKERLEEELAKTSVAYLPFPDGASERRGSLIALIMNSVAIVTKRGSQSPEEMRKAVLWADSPESAARTFEKLCDAGTQARLQQKAKAYARRFAWDRIAEQHIQAYSRIAGETPPSPKSEMV